MKPKKQSQADVFDRRRRLSLTIVYSLVVFVILFLTLGIATAVLMLLIHNGVLKPNTSSSAGVDMVILVMASTGVVIGTILTFFASRVPLLPVNKLINALNRLAAGNYKTRLSFGKPFGKSSSANELCDSFNRLADELDHTEMLRTDFINNFSHEFKTPIVSIAGFAGLLRNETLSVEERNEYVEIIAEESERLVSMATNVLNLTKVENQTILTDLSDFNLSEQIRASVLLLAPKWAKKEIDWDMEFDEFTVRANEEMLKQVWINLIDNAIKFSPVGGRIGIGVTENDGRLRVTVTNAGEPIPPTAQERIWRKFYQADESHATEGNGIGLAIVKRIVELHEGCVGVTSDETQTGFFVEIPAKPRGTAPR